MPLTLTVCLPAPDHRDRWELTAHGSGEILAKGFMPVDHEAVRRAARAFFERPDGV